MGALCTNAFARTCSALLARIDLATWTRADVRVVELHQEAAPLRPTDADADGLLQPCRLPPSFGRCAAQTASPSKGRRLLAPTLNAGVPKTRWRSPASTAGPWRTSCAMRVPTRQKS